MFVKMLRYAAGDGRNLAVGQVYEVSDEEAREWIRDGAAQEVRRENNKYVPVIETAEARRGQAARASAKAGGFASTGKDGGVELDDEDSAEKKDVQKEPVKQAHPATGHTPKGR